MLGTTGWKRASTWKLSSYELFHILFFFGTECRGQKRKGLRARLQLPPCPKNTQIFHRLDSGDTLAMASVDRSVSGWLRSEDLLHTGLIVALLLGEFVSSSSLSMLADALFPNSSVSLSFSTIQPFYRYSHLFSWVVSALRTAVTGNLYLFECGPSPAPSSVLLSIVIVI